MLAHIGRCWPMFPHVGPCFRILAHVGPCWLMLAHVGPSWPALAHGGPWRPMLAHVGPCPCWPMLPMLSHVVPCWPMLAPVGPCWPMLARVGPCWPMAAHVGLCWSMWLGWVCGSRWGCGCSCGCGGPALDSLGPTGQKSSLPSTRNALRFCMVGGSSVGSPAQTVLPSTPNAYFLQNRRSHLRKTIIFHDCVHAGGPVAVAAIAVRWRAPIWRWAMLGPPLQNIASRLREMHTFRKTRFPSTRKPYFWRGTTSIISDSPELHSKNI